MRGEGASPTGKLGSSLYSNAPGWARPLNPTTATSYWPHGMHSVVPGVVCLKKVKTLRGVEHQRRRTTTAHEPRTA